MKKKSQTNQKTFGILGGFSSGLGIIGLHNVCHVVCEGVIVFLAVFGIAIVGMPLAFLQDYSLFFSVMGMVSAASGIAFYLWTRKTCKMTKKQNFWLVLNIFVLMISTYGIMGGIK